MEKKSLSGRRAEPDFIIQRIAAHAYLQSHVELLERGNCKLLMYIYIHVCHLYCTVHGREQGDSRKSIPNNARVINKDRGPLCV